jgi:hypothetical protein
MSTFIVLPFDPMSIEVHTHAMSDFTGEAKTVPLLRIAEKQIFSMK